MSNKVLIQVPHGLPAQMVVAYIDRCRVSLSALKEALHRSDYEHARVFGHRLKGTGGGYGIPVLTEIGGAIELAAIHKQNKELEAQTTAIEDYISRIEVQP
jgi:HPt (histidine-containing phosphotransfer) domain-containing protein